jgi:bacterioferritin-associated ferredoxin
MKPDDTLCYCFHVTQRKVLNHLRIYRPKRASQLSDCGGAGTGCGWCIPYLKRLFEQHGQPAAFPASPGELASPATSQDPLLLMTPEEYSQQRAAYIRAGRGVPAAGAIPLPPEPPPPLVE